MPNTGLSASKNVPEEPPKRTIRQRVISEPLYAKALTLGFLPPIARALAGRPLPMDVDLVDHLMPAVESIESPSTFVDIDVGAQLLANAYEQKAYVVLVSDFDCDGVTAAATFYRGLPLLGYSPGQLGIEIGHRLKDGYGISDNIVNRIEMSSNRPDLIISADCGSSDEPRIARLRNLGIPVIVTDHHEIPVDGIPKSAAACINPQRSDCQFPDKSIAGCMVAWYLLEATRLELVQRGHIPDAREQLLPLLSFTAIGTIADCVSLANSRTNRAVFRYGISRIERQTGPAWRALVRASPSPEKPLDSEFAGFFAGPMLNSAGRLDDAMTGVKLLISDTDQEAERICRLLRIANDSRKEIERSMVTEAMSIAKQQVMNGRLSLAVYLDTGHAGVHGISASRLKEAFGRPAAFISPKHGNDDLVTASLRGIEGLHLREALQFIEDSQPGFFVAFGGHKYACGATFPRKLIEEFTALFETAIRQQITVDDVGPYLFTDGVISPEHICQELIEQIHDLEPWGKDFDRPVFECIGVVTEIKAMGKPAVHLRVGLQLDGNLFQAVWFSALDSEKSQLPIRAGEKVNVVFSVDNNYFRGNRSIQLMIKAVY